MKAHLLNPTLRKFLAAGTLGVATIIGFPGSVHAARPNIIVIQTDDQNYQTVKSSFRGKNGKSSLTMPATVKKIYRGGTQFRNFYTTSPVCSPSRASLLTGQYPANSKLVSNEGSRGGWEGWKKLPIYNKNLAVSLQDSGYRTAHVGKFTNGYYDQAYDRVDTTIPPGWNNWFTTAYLPGTRYYGYKINDNGFAVGPYGNPDYYRNGPGIDSRKCTKKTLQAPPNSLNCNYLQDVMTRFAVRTIKQKRNKPLFLSLDYQAPHGDVRPPKGPQAATRHLDTAGRTPLPRDENFNEKDISDKSPLIQSYISNPLGGAEIQQITNVYRRELESLRSVDDGVRAIFKTLRKTGRLDNTYVFYLSDHGYFFGEHRFGLAKFLPYEPSSRVSMAVRGPDVPRGQTSNEVTGNIDVPATILRLAGADSNYAVDGRSLRSFWKDPSKKTTRPLGISLEAANVEEEEEIEEASTVATTDGASISAKAPALRYHAVRIGPYKLIDYRQGGDELYNLSNDPYELRNRFDADRYEAVRSYMKNQLKQVRNCSGPACREVAPPWPLPGD